MAARVTPFAWDTLPKVSRTRLVASRPSRRCALDLAQSLWEKNLAAVVGKTISVSQMPRASERAAIRAIGVTFESAHGDRMTAYVPTDLASVLVAAATKSKAPTVIDLDAEPSRRLGGAVAAVLSASFHRSGLGLLLTDVESRAAPPTDCATVAVGIDESTYAVDLFASAWQARGGARGVQPPIGLAIVSSVAWAPWEELSAIEPGDLWITPSPSSTPQPVWLSTRDAEFGLHATLDPEGRLRYEGKQEPFAMADDPKTTLLSQAPVVVRVELGTVELPFHEWAALSPGDTLDIGVTPNGPVVLRAGTQEIARGELVTMDGNIAVRITSTADHEETARVSEATAR